MASESCRLEVCVPSLTLISHMGTFLVLFKELTGVGFLLIKSALPEWNLRPLSLISLTTVTSPWSVLPIDLLLNLVKHFC